MDNVEGTIIIFISILLVEIIDHVYGLSIFEILGLGLLFVFIGVLIYQRRKRRLNLAPTFQHLRS